MKIKQLQLKNFRLFNDLDVEFNSTSNIFVGNNAQGKTTLLESIHVLAFTKSHKNIKDDILIQNGTDYAKIKGLMNFNDRKVSLELILSKNGKKAKYNGIEMNRLSEYVGQFNVVLFAPEDLDLVKGNPKTRRRFLDLELGQTSKLYLNEMRQYQKILKDRNQLLKTMQSNKNKDFMLLDVITEQLITYQSNIVDYRKEFIRDINDIANKFYKFISDSETELEMKYVPSVQNDYEKNYKSKYEFDLITGTTNLGVHRDDIEFYLDEKEAKNYASQGEQRTIVLAIKLSLIDYIYRQTKRYPVFLLDDVLSELDSIRQNKLFEIIDKNTQTFITTTNITEIQKSVLENATIYAIEKGNIKEMKHNVEYIWFK